MIISASRRTAFCHIPKNGGSSLRYLLQDKWEDSRHYQGRQEVGGEMRDLTHLTPTEAAVLFEDDLIGAGYTIMAVVRAPMSRINSALLQYVRSFGLGDRNFIDAAAVEKTLAQTSISALCEASGHDHRCIFFRRQSDFLEGVPEAARDLILIENLSARFPDLPVENRGGRLPGWLKGANSRFTKQLIDKLGRKTKARLLTALTTQDSLVHDVIANAITSEASFLAEFYRDDQELYDQIRLTIS
jgi:hypothetical protein